MWFMYLHPNLRQRYFSVSLPQKIEALRGSCVIIKCTFEIDKQYDQYLTERATTGLWLKDGTEEDPHQVFNSRDHKPDHFNGKITGKLHKKNCTTVFYDVSSNHNGKYYFRITSGKDLKYTYRQSFSTIDVIESPPKPRVQLYVAQDQEEVLEGSSVSLRCSAETLCSSPPATLTWSSTPRIPLSESSRLQELISDLNFTATHREHGVTFTCTITYQLQDKNKTAQDSITVHVQYSPKNTAVSVAPSSSVLEGSSVTLICSSDANPAVNYTWSRESEGQLEQLQTGDTLTFNRTDPTHRSWYHCTAQNQHGAQNSSVKLDIQYAPKISSSSSCSRTDVTVCFCEADGNPSPELEWHLSGRPVTNSSNTFISEERLSSTGLRSSITLHQSLTHTSTLQCVSNNTRGTARKLLQLPAFDELAVVALAVVLLCAVTYTRVRKDDGKLPQTTQEVPERSGQNADEVAPQGNQDDPVYVMKSSAGAATANQASIIYSSIDFTNAKPREVRSVSSYHAIYAVVQDCSGGLSKTKSSIGESKQSEEELFEDSSQLYAKVKC
ncbi:myelin-associated glycoprotein-like [Onychostoma macrolepis]|uniref:myelin-associated glycoprotein-like n=1 Tax=Onychostoma macrolepis TaxID=369639 RepID=UPI00272C8CDF|nr:myelin-associated glycoprotein-like [Onychostoma macrolepis]